MRVSKRLLSPSLASGAKGSRGWRALATPTVRTQRPRIRWLDIIIIITIHAKLSIQIVPYLSVYINIRYFKNTVHVFNQHSGTQFSLTIMAQGTGPNTDNLTKGTTFGETFVLYVINGVTYYLMTDVCRLMSYKMIRDGTKERMILKFSDQNW